MIDQDLALLYETETRLLNEAVKRNMKRFPSDFMFQLTKEDFENIKLHVDNDNSQGLISQNAISNDINFSLRSQNVSSKRGGNRHLPYAFTEQGVAMLSGILNSDKAIAMNIAIMRAFVDIRKLLLEEINFKKQLKQIKEKLGAHDIQLNEIYDAMENLLDEKIAQKKWEERERIGFKNKS